MDEGQVISDESLCAKVNGGRDVGFVTPPPKAVQSKHTMQTERFGIFKIESGGGSKREVEEYVIHPNLVKSLRVGKCVCIKKYPESRAYLVDVNPN